MRTVAFATTVLMACVDTQAPIAGTQSLKIDLVSPTSPGSVTQRLPDTARAVTLAITALDPDGNTDTTFANPLQVYAHFLGTLTPYLGDMPLATVPIVAGKGTLSLTLPPVFGPTTVWFDDGADANATYATGVSDTLWFRDPFVVDIQTPTNEMSINALSTGPLDNKNIDVEASRYGASGRLIVTSVYSQGYTLADVNCANAAGDPPCVSQDYDYMDVYSYSAPLDQDKRFISEGQLVDGFAGGVTEFDGLTEIGFPQTFIAGNPIVDKSREPATVVFDPTWFQNPILFERNESGAIEVDNGKVCPLDSDYITYKQWKLDPAGIADPATCSSKSVFNIISSGIVDPTTLVGKVVPRVVGMLRPINIGSFNVWIIYPRSMADFTLN